MANSNHILFKKSHTSHKKTSCGYSELMPESMTRLLIATFFLLLTTCNAQKCPNNVAVAKECQKSEECDNGGICYRDLSGSDTEKGFCCTNLNTFCKSTGLTTFHSPSKGRYKHIFHKSLNGMYYMDRKTKAACPIPYSAATITFEKSGPTGFKKDSETTVSKACKQNKDCANGDYCAPSVNPSYSTTAKTKHMKFDESNKKQPLLFCYPLPKLDSKVKIVLVNEAVSFKFCNAHAECDNHEEICYITAGSVRQNDKKEFKGICVKVTMCPNSKDTSAIGALSNTKSFCKKNEDCQNVGTFGDSNHDHNCRMFDGGEKNKGNLCCFEKTSLCVFGKVATPPQSCQTTIDCNMKNNRTARLWTKWCDSKTKFCCHDMEENSLWQCPDKVTPLFNEPVCKNAKKSDEFSGSCTVDKNAICRNGHCCPSLTVKDGKAILGTYPYVTAFPCDPQKPVPRDFFYAFCDPKTKTIIIFGKKHKTDEKVVKTGTKKCSVNADCSLDGSRVCVSEIKEESYCYFNPLREQRAKVSEGWKYVLIVSLICSFVFALTAIMCMVCYRSKSVFDVRKKSKKKNKKAEKSEKTEATGGETETTKTSQSQIA